MFAHAQTSIDTRGGTVWAGLGRYRQRRRVPECANGKSDKFGVIVYDSKTNAVLEMSARNAKWHLATVI
jgi:hypothetical protein